VRPADLEEIRSLALFAGMGAQTFAALTRGAYVQTFPPQVDLIAQGEPADFLHVVTDGAVELFATANGRETSMQLVRPVSTFILAATIRDAPNLMSARTIEKARLVMIPSGDVRTVFAEDAAFARAIVTELAQRYRAVVKTTKDLKLRSSAERLANYLLRQSARHGRAEFELDIEKRRLAAYLGMTAENLSRAFRGLQAHGVEIDGARVTIADRARLERLAAPDPLIDDPET